MFDPASYHATETLNDGRKVEIRAQQPGDREGFRAAVRRASTEDSLSPLLRREAQVFRAKRSFLPRHRLAATSFWLR